MICLVKYIKQNASWLYCRSYRVTIHGRAEYIPSARTGRHRAAFFADIRLKLREIRHLCSRDLAAGVCVIGNKQTLIISAYLDIYTNVRTEAQIKVLEYQQDKRLGLILAIDSNQTEHYGDTQPT